MQEDGTQSSSTAAGARQAPLCADAVYLIADIVGSSRICNTLVETEGRRAGDRLSRIINASFGPLVEMVRVCGGRVLDMAGDSLHAVWIVRPDADRGALLAQVETAAAEAVIALSDQSSADGVPVEARIGLGTGSILVGAADRVGQTRVVAGAAIEAATAALADAPPGSVKVRTGTPPVVTRLQSSDAPDAPGAEALLPSLASRYGIAGAAADFLAPEGETRALTVMAISLAGPERAFAMSVSELEALTEAAQTALEPHAAVLENPHLDEKGLTLMAVFGLRGRSDDAGRPEVFAAAGSLAERSPAGSAPRIGIATGRIFIGAFRVGAETRHLCFGMPLVVSTRLMEAAGDAPLLDDETARLASRAHWQLAEKPPTFLKGAHTGLAVSALGRAQQPTPPTQAPRALVGRDAELGRIDAFFSVTARFRALVLRGRSGSGKSELLRHARAAAVATAAPLVELAPKAFPSNRHLSAWDEALAEHLPSVRGALENHDDPEHVRHLATIADGLVTRWADAPPVLMIDDAHWLDEASALLCLRLWRALPGLRLVLALDSDADRRTERWLRRLMLAEVDIVDLGGLDIEAMHALLCARLGVDEIEDGALRRIHDLSEGVPDAAIAIARTARAGLSRFTQRSSDRALSPRAQEVELPLSVSDAVERAIGRFTPAARRVLKIASAAGRRIDPSLLRRAGAGSESEITGALNAAREAGLVERVVAGDGRIGHVFRSEMIRNVAYGMMAEASAVQAHGALARAIEEETSRSPAEREAELAYHWSRSAERAKAMRHLSRAGASAYRRAEYSTVLPWLERALHLAEQSRGDPATRVSAFREALWCCWAADSQIHHGNLQRAGELCRRGLQLLGAPVAETAAGWSMLGARTGFGLMGRGVAARLRRSGKGRLSDRLQGWLTGLLYGRLCECLYYQSNETGMMATALLASDLRERSGLPGGLAMPDALLSYAFGVSGIGGLSRWFNKRTRSIATARDRREGLQYSLGTDALISLALGKIGAAEVSARDALALAAERSDRDSAALARTILAMILHQAGRFRETAAAFEELARQARLEGNDQHLAWGLYARASAFLPLGRTEEAWRDLTLVGPLIELVDDDLSKLNYAAIMGMAALERGETALAEDWARRAQDLAEVTPHNNWGSFEGFFTTT
ncbi:MAG: AAA family ATPase, partial [Pseudomonadota bacterium]